MFVQRIIFPSSSILSASRGTTTSGFPMPRERTIWYFSSIVSILRLITVTLLKASFEAEDLRNRVFLRFESHIVSLISFLKMAIGNPGNPPPLPASKHTDFSGMRSVSSGFIEGIKCFFHKFSTSCRETMLFLLFQRFMSDS